MPKMMLLSLSVWRPRARAQALAGLLAAFAGAPAFAEKADRQQPMVVESDGKQAASVDLAKKITVISGHVQVRQGSLLILADKVEIRETESGQYLATARALPGSLARFRQKRDKADEFIEGQAETVDYDGAQERVRLSGQARLRILRAGQVGDEASAAVITYDQKADTIVFDGGTASPSGSAASSPGRARLVFLPRSEAASAPAAGGAR